MDGPKNTIPADFVISTAGLIVDVYYGKNMTDHIPLERVLERYPIRGTDLESGADANLRDALGEPPPAVKSYDLPNSLDGRIKDQPVGGRHSKLEASSMLPVPLWVTSSG